MLLHLSRSYSAPPAGRALPRGRRRGVVGARATRAAPPLGGQPARAQAALPGQRRDAREHAAPAEGLCRFEGRFGPRGRRGGPAPPVWRRFRRRQHDAEPVPRAVPRDERAAARRRPGRAARGDVRGRLAAPAARARRRRGECGCAEEAAFRATRECGCAGSLLLGPDVAAAYAGSTDVDPGPSAGRRARWAGRSTPSSSARACVEIKR